MRSSTTSLLQIVHQLRLRSSQYTAADAWWLAAVGVGLVLCFLCFIAYVSTLNPFWLSVMVAILYGEVTLIVAYLVWRVWRAVRELQANAAAGISDPPSEQDRASLVFICWIIGLALITIPLAYFFLPTWAGQWVMLGTLILASICAVLWLRLRRRRQRA